MWYRILLGLRDYGVLLFRYLTSRTYFFLQFHRTLYAVLRQELAQCGYLNGGCPVLSDDKTFRTRTKREERLAPGNRSEITNLTPDTEWLAF